MKLLFFQKATAVMIVDFARTQDYEELKEGAYAQDELNIRANAPCFCLKVVRKKGGGVYFRELTILSTYILVLCD